MRKSYIGVFLWMLASAPVAAAQAAPAPAVQPDVTPSAQPDAPPSAVAPAPAVVAQAAPPPDVVRLKNGGMVRGTIAEYLPGEHVSIILMSGETKRFEAAEVAYAGSAASEPRPSSEPAHPGDMQDLTTSSEVQPLVTVRSNKARIHLSAKGPEPLTFYLLSGTASAGYGRGISADAFTRICAAPCDANIAAGSYTLGLAPPDQAALRVKTMVDIHDGDELVGTYRSARGTRAAGWIIFAVSLIGGTGLMVASIEDDGASPAFLAGSVIAGIGPLVGLALANFAKDSAYITKRGT